MTQCNCKICRNNLTDIVNQKAKEDNIGYSDIKKYLYESHDLSVTENVVKRHLKAYGIEINNQVDPTVNEVFVEVNQGVINNQNKIITDLNNITLDKYNFDENDARTIVKYLQKIHLGLYLKQLEITYQEIEEYKLGLRENYPNVAVNNLKKLFELLDSLTGISIYSNQQAAVKTVEAMGLKIERFESYIKSENV
ncbi:MAG: hypothetical protein ACKPE3_04975 [Sphaerospermopsis kisseleviana]